MFTKQTIKSIAWLYVDMALKKSRYKLILKAVSGRQANEHKNVTLYVYVDVRIDVGVYM